MLLWRVFYACARKIGKFTTPFTLAKNAVNSSEKGLQGEAARKTQSCTRASGIEMVDWRGDNHPLAMR
jgi:hypothetical protein